MPYIKEGVLNETIALESSPDCVKILDLEGRLQFMNFYGRCLMEIDEFDTLKGNFWWDLWGDESKEMVHQSIKDAKRGEIVQFTAFCPTAKGTPKWWSVLVTPIKDQNGIVREIISSSRDITQERQHQEELRKTKEFLKNGLEVAKVVILEVDYATNLVHLTPEAAVLFGFPPDTKTITREQIRATFHPNYRDTLDQKIQELLITGEMYLDHPIIMPNDGIRWLRVNQKLYYKDGNKTEPEYSIIAARDITHWKETQQQLADSELKFRTMANSIPQLAWIINPDGWIVWYNDRWYDYTGTTLEEMQGSGWQKVHHPNMVESVTTKFKQHIESGAEWEDTFLLRGKDGQYRWFLSRAIPLKDEAGHIIQWFGTNTDISKEIAMQENLNALNASLEERVNQRTKELIEKNRELAYYNEQLNQFNFVASHDLKEPLRKIQLFASRAIKSEEINDKMSDILSKINTTAEKMQHFIDDIEKFSRIQSMEVETTMCHIPTIVKEIEDDLEYLIKQKNATIICQSDLTLNCPSSLLSDLLFNLISNALKYNKNNVPPIIIISDTMVLGATVAHSNSIPEQYYYCICIKDNGIGFEQEYAEKIFEPFKRLHRKEEYTGTGIGLTICKNIAARLKGFITAESQINEGAAFKIYIPS